MIEVGKLYSCSEYFLMLYPDKDTAAAAVPAAAAAVPAAAVPVAHPEAVPATAAYWSKKFDKPVSYCNPLTPLLVLSVKEQYIEVLAEDKRGWIINMDWLELKKIR
jgi:hypothetical protein